MDLSYLESGTGYYHFQGYQDKLFEERRECTNLGRLHGHVGFTGRVLLAKPFVLKKK